MKPSRLEKLKSALRWVKTGTILSIIVYSAIMADIIFHNSSGFRALSVLPKFWLAVSIPLIFIIWVKVSVVMMRKIGFTRCLFITLGLIVVALGLLHFASQPIATTTTVWVSPTSQIAHKTYPHYLNTWVNFCASLGAHLCMISSINLAINWQPTVTATTTDS